MGRIVTFNVTCIGASHIKSGKPCQDYSLSWHSDDGAVSVAIVCDGHGGDSYVRSDRGSRLAAEIAMRNIRNVVEYTPAYVFLDKEGAVTARPEDEDDIFHTNRKTAEADTSDYDEEDIRRQRQTQNSRFYEAIESIREQDRIMQQLFASIYLQWMAAIEEDAGSDPFTAREKEMLNGARIAKAYGTTLMAYVRTPLYWFAFHIGDGKMLGCDANFKWKELVPWDCNCFLNITTSLCDSEPLHSFRYAFNGNGDFPVAVIMGSDGLDDSWGTMANLENFYSQVLNIFNDLKEEETLKQMKEYLPRLSEKGSRDDMSMSGVIDMDAIANGAEVYKKQRELNALYDERKKREKSIADLQHKLEAAGKEVEKLNRDYQEEKKKESSLLARLSLQKGEIQSAENKLQSGKENKLAIEQNLMAARQDFDNWMVSAGPQKARLEREYDTLVDTGCRSDARSRASWQQRREAYIVNSEDSKKQALSDKVAYMMECDEEAARGIHVARFEPEEGDSADETLPTNDNAQTDVCTITEDPVIEESDNEITESGESGVCKEPGVTNENE